MVTGFGSDLSPLGEDSIQEIIRLGCPPREQYLGKRVLVLTPDATRTCPLPSMVNALRVTIGEEVQRLDFLIALGTHQPLNEEQILNLYGITSGICQTTFVKSRYFNHRWDLEETFYRIGYLSEEQTAELSGGMLREKVPVDVNKIIFNYDLILILGPVFPHEVVGFSGGAKYFFPGISGGDFLHFFHWLGAVTTCPKTIGIKETPARQAIHLAMNMIDLPVYCFSMVVKSSRELYGLYAASYQESWNAAADLSAQVHVVLKERSFHTVLGVCPRMYDDLWTGGKVMYKLEQVVAAGGELIIYAPHLTELSKTWGKYLEQIGYHTVGYFLSQTEKFKSIPRGVLAHSTHVRGIGTMQEGKEMPRIKVTLASSIPEEKCRKLNLGYRDYRTIDLDTYRERESEGILLVERAGEILYKLKESHA